ncbi:MAG: tRNA(Ile2) 2-agmatinylcytidine synthetase [Methanomicrobiaceae archaeon]|nr:tRNA(Ile2) 2-agmatinylcytidine synthetase [Methanomicrobiaceae archaeon]
MIVLTPDEIRQRYGTLFSKKFLVMADEAAGIAEIIEHCSHRGTIEWDAMNRRRAGGAARSISVEGTAMSIVAAIGSYPVHFGAAGSEIGGQALEGVEILGEDEIATTWAGIAGAGVGVAACLPQAPGVLRAEYPSEEDMKIGGARTNRVRIISPRYEKITIGIDDTDTKEEGATWVLALQCAEQCPVEGVEYLNMRLIQLNPAVPKKTTNCVGSALNFAVRPGSVDALLDYVREYIETNAVSDDAGIAVHRGIALPDDSPFLARIKTDIVSIEEAQAEASRLGIRYIDSAARKGRIGALGSVLWGNRGIEAAGLYGEHT